MNNSRFRAARKYAVGLTVAATAAGLLIATAEPAAAATNPSPNTGQRHGATRLSFGVSGSAGLSVDVATGNVQFIDQLITLPGVTASAPVTLWFNSAAKGSGAKSSVTNSTGSGWGISGFDQRLVVNSDNSVTYYGQGGLTGVFAVNGTGYSAPAQFQADLVKTGSTGWTLTDHTSQTKLTFNAGGRLTKSQDRNANATTFNYDPYGYPSSIVSSRGGTAAETLNLGLSGDRITTLTQTSGSLTRKVTLAYSSGGNLFSITDTAGGVTDVDDYADDGQLTTIKNPSGETTTIGYTSGKATSIVQSNSTGAGTATTRLQYNSGQTLEADPTTSQSSSVSAVAHTTYAITTDGSLLVSSTTDPNGHLRSKTYTSLGQVKTATAAAGGTTSYTYGANNNESLTSVGSAGGATGSAAYTNSSPNQYLPSSSTDDASNATNYTYNGAGNQLSSASGTGPQANVTYNSDGTVATSASPGAATGVQTNYNYDSTTHNLTGLTPPTGSSLGTRAYTWDGFGRLATATDGRGNTITYTYDNADRITKVDYSDAATHDVSYTYDAEGRVTNRVDGSGTSTYTYDELGHLKSKVNTAGGGTISYGYDLAGAVASETDGHGTTTYQYDPAHQLTSMTYPSGSSTAITGFAYDNSGRRTDTWLQTNSAHSTWAAHTHTTYDSSGRVTRVLSQLGPATGPSTVLDDTYCYAAVCATGTAADRSNIQVVKNAVNGETHTFTYDGNGRLSKDTVTGGSNPRTYSYTYDSAGNRKTASVTGSSPSSQTLTYNNGNQINTSGYSYDGAGNLLGDTALNLAATWDTAGQLTKANVSGAATTYTYAGTNQAELTKASVYGGNTYEFAYGRADQNGLPEIEEVTLTNSSGTVYHAYVEHDNTGLPVMLETSTGTVAMYVYDGQQNPIGLVTNFSAVAYLYSFDPYGTATVVQNSGGTGLPQNPYVFGGGLQDRSTGLIKFGARWYNPATGSWIQQDRLNAPLSPTNGNRYAYVGDDPVNRFDPTGADFLNISLSACLGICLDVGIDIGDDGSVNGTVGAGVGPDAGVDVSATGHTGEAETGGSLYGQCTAGGGEVGVDTNGSDAGAYAGVTSSTEEGCEVGGDYTF